MNDSAPQGVLITRVQAFAAFAAELSRVIVGDAFTTEKAPVKLAVQDALSADR